MSYCKKLRSKDLKAFAKKAIEELGLTNNEVMLFMYGGQKQCPDCKELHLFIDRLCPRCGILVSMGKEFQKEEVE